MSKSWHVVNALKEKGPMNQFQLWNTVKGTGDFKSRTGFKQVVNNLRKFERIAAMPVADNITNTKDHLYMITSKQSNFIPRSLSIVQVARRREAGKQLRSFISEVNKAEKTLLSQYHATHPLEGAVYNNRLKQKVQHRKSAKNSRRNLRKVQRTIKVQKETAKEQKLGEAKASLKLTPAGKVTVKAQDTPQKKKLALELNRMEGSKKRIQLLHADLIKKGQQKMIKVRTRMRILNRAGKKGSPERKAAVEKITEEAEKRAARLKKWRVSKAKAYAKKSAVLANVKPEPPKLEKAFMADITAAPASYLRDAARQKLEKQRNLEKRPKVKNVQKQ